MQYIGSTTVNIARRYIEHKSKYRQYLLGKYHYTSSFKIIANDDFSIEQLDERYCETKRELLDLEGYYIRLYKKLEGDNLINVQIPSRTSYEYQRDNKERISIYKRGRNQYIKACKELRDIEV
jgi:hypothetical protein